ncbi:hypothetical protein B566_EDAN016526 [Ephemera danica]|nr:hypothetical protein B566_EDAN016526 [Ephemera danica]
MLAKSEVEPCLHFWCRSRTSGGGDEAVRDILGFPPLIVSVLCIVLTCLLAHLLRSIVLRNYQPSVWRSLAEEAIAGAELCGCCFELIIVADNYGVWMYGLILFLLTVWWGRQWGDATACPYTYLEDMLEGRSNYGVAILKTVAGLIGGLAVFKYVQFLWSFELTPTHVGRSTARCTADLQVPVLYGLIIECAATFLCRISSKTISKLEPKFGGVLDSFIGTSLVVAAFDTSGGYFNPLLATGLKVGCRGHTFLQFLAVYWVGSTLGSAAATQVFKMQAVRDLLLGTASKPTAPPPEEPSIWDDMPQD